MYLKKIFPYVIAIPTLLSVNALASYEGEASSDFTKRFEQKYKASDTLETEYDLQKQMIEYKVQQLITTYIDNAVNGAKRILESKKHTNYLSAVRKELPGAPSDKKRGTVHCLYGQYTQLNRAIQEIGDTIQIIPNTNNAHMATSSFKRNMSQLYDNPEYPNSIHRGCLYATDTEYTKALNKYLSTQTNNKKGDADSLRTHYTKEFEKNNYCASTLNPGTIIIVSSGHAIMYLGQGEIKNNEFVPDENGQAICCAYNHEQTAIYLRTWDTKNSFAADIQNIATQKYYAQLVKTR